MQRKTNIFYNSGIDSKFLTFSNYTECLTGNFLSTNHKIFPSKFMCFYWELLDKDFIENDIERYKKNLEIIANNPGEDEDDLELFDVNDLIKEYILSKVSEEDANGLNDFDDPTKKEEYISNVEKYHKELLIRYLQCYYENKLAFLRDYCIKSEDFYDLNNPSETEDEDTHPENKLYPLSYLFETLYKLGIVKLTTAIDSNGNTLKYYKIEYVSNVTEQDYKGTYADTICIVDLSNNYKGKLKPTYFYNENIQGDDTRKEFSQLMHTNDQKPTYSYININTNYSKIFGTDQHIYGWTNDELNSLYTDEAQREQYGLPIYDNINDEIEDKNRYYMANEWAKIDIVEEKDETEMKFNLIVPLFDIVNIDYTTAESKIINVNGINDYQEEDIEFGDLDLDNPYNKNVPLGIWISDDVVTIKKDESTNYSPVWSLVISSQFKPFPYGNISNINKTDIPIEYNTYAQIIANQNSLFNAISDLNARFTAFYKEFENFKSQTTNLATQYNIGAFKNQITTIEKSLNEQYDNLETQLTNVVNDLKWKGMY